VNENQRLEYMMARMKGIHAINALRMAKASENPKLAKIPDLKPWRSGLSTSWDDGVWRFTARVTDDEWADISHLGEFTDTREKGAIPTGEKDSRRYKYFIPAIPLEDHRSYWVTEGGMDKQSAYLKALENVRQDMKQAMEYRAVIVTVSVAHKRRPDVELGSSSVGGVDVTDLGDYSQRERDDWLKGTILEQASAALAEAKEALADLCKDC
jgi:hypothetical protein